MSTEVKIESVELWNAHGINETYRVTLSRPITDDELDAVVEKVADEHVSGVTYNQMSDEPDVIYVEREYDPYYAD